MPFPDFDDGEVPEVASSAPPTEGSEVVAGLVFMSSEVGTSLVSDGKVCLSALQLERPRATSGPQRAPGRPDLSARERTRKRVAVKRVTLRD